MDGVLMKRVAVILAENLRGDTHPAILQLSSAWDLGNADRVFGRALVTFRNAGLSRDRQGRGSRALMVE